MKITDKFETPAKLSVLELIPIKFDTPDAFFQNLIADRKFWTLLESRASAELGTEPPANYALQAIRQQVEQAITRFQQVASTNASEDQFKMIVIEYANRKLLPSISAPAQFILKLADTDALQALRVAICCCEVKGNLSQSPWGTKWARAGGLAEVLLRGWISNAEGLDGALSKFATSWDARLTQVDDSFNARLEEITKSSSDFSALFSATSDQARQLIDTHRENVAKEIADGRAQINAVKETYNAELTLQAPTTYWRAKQISHRWTSLAWALAFFIVAGAGAWSVWTIWHVTAEPIFDKTPGASSYGLLIPTIGAAFLAIWTLRIVSRQLLTNLTLSSDAGERVFMVKTFLALMQKPDHVKEADRVLILSALFRPALSSEDDGAPPNWFDLVMQRLK